MTRGLRRPGGTPGTVAVVSEGLLARLEARDRSHLRLQSHQSEIRRRWDFEFFNRIGRVEMWRGRCRLLASLLPALSYAGAPLAKPCPRFHIPLIEPDRWNYHIRLSDKAPRPRPRKVIGRPADYQHRPVLPVPDCLAVGLLTTANATNHSGAHSLPRSHLDASFA